MPGPKARPDAHKNQVCVVGRDQFLFTSSVVVTLVTVMQSDTTCPATNEKMNRFVQRLFHRAQTLPVKAPTEE